MKKRLMVWLCLALLLAMWPAGGVLAAEEPQAQANTTMTLLQLQTKYPHGTYWNHTKGGNEDYTTTPCNHHTGNCTYSGSCGCNTYKGKSVQCMGFAYQLAYLAYGDEPRDWASNTNTSALDNLKAGDIVRYQWNGHSIFVTAVEGDTVTYADCNSDRRCGIRWGVTVSKATLKASFTYVKASPFALKNEPALTVTYHAGGGNIPNEVVGTTYRVLSDNGINMRKDAGTGNAKVTALPYNTTFTVQAGDTKEASGYTWGKTTYNGKTGWVVISDFVEKIGEAWSGEWRVSDGLVCRGDGTPLTDAYGKGKPIEALADAVQLGLVKEGYRFGGWCTTVDGSGTMFAAGMKPEELCADGETVTLYALWNPIIVGDADGNGRVNNKDLGLLQRYLNEWEVTVAAEADINGDGAINNKDLGLLQQIINGWNEGE